MPLRGDCLLPISQGVALGWGLIAPSGRYRMHADNHWQKYMDNYMKFMDNYMVIICSVIVMQLFYASLINFSTFFSALQRFFYLFDSFS